MAAARKIRRRLPRQVPPDAYARKYSAILRAFVAELVKVAQELEPRYRYAVNEVISLRTANIQDSPASLLRIVQLMLANALDAKTINDLELTRMAFATADYQAKQLKKVAEALQIGFSDLPKQVTTRAEVWVVENASLISSIKNSFADRVHQNILKAVQSGERWENLAETIKLAGQVTEARAEVIARDQIGKLYGQINADRQRAAGVLKFVWRTSRDNRVRQEHEDLEGRVFNYDDPPEIGLPGEPIQCRCYAEPVIEDEE